LIFFSLESNNSAVVPDAIWFVNNSLHWSEQYLGCIDHFWIGNTASRLAASAVRNKAPMFQASQVLRQQELKDCRIILNPTVVVILFWL
jgi:hypothetical protein